MKRLIPSLACLLLLTSISFAGDNLLVPMPATKFWYPPYASEQPDAKSGTFTLDLGKASGKKMAVFEIDLPPGMKPGSKYLFEFVATAKPPSAIIVIVPEADPTGKKSPDGKAAGKSEWGLHNAGKKPRSVEFVFDPDVTPQKLQLFWNDKELPKAPVFEFSGFSLKELD